MAAVSAGPARARSQAPGLGAALGAARQGRADVHERLRRFVAIPSVSADPARREDVNRAARWLAGEMRAAGLERVELVATGGAPVVVADWVHHRDRPTVLVYGHYDVQPADVGPPWRTHPFRPVIQGDVLRGRGASDDKGPVLAHICAFRAWMAAGGPPANVRFVVEGAEEVGSPGFGLFLERHRDRLHADVAVVSDTRILGPERPALTYALRGALNIEVTVRGAPADLHSGSFGGVAPQPAAALAAALGSLHHEDGRVAVRGFDGRGTGVGPAERARLRRDGPSDQAVADAGRLPAVVGDTAYTAFERTTIRPALTVTGITAGYGGPGPKSVIPAVARAKLNVRLVPGQDPALVGRRVAAHLRRATASFEGVRIDVRLGAASRAVELPTKHPVVGAARAAYRVGFGRDPVLLRSGGTIPPAGLLAGLGLPIVLLGFSLPDDGIHGPNEKLHLPTFWRGVETCIAFSDAVARLGWRRPRRER